GQLPTEALNALLPFAGGARLSDVTCFATAEPEIQLPTEVATERIDHHRAHAATAFHFSPFSSAAVLVSDGRLAEPTSVWIGDEGRLTKQDWPHEAGCFAALYAEAAARFGFAPSQVHEL